MKKYILLIICGSLIITACKKEKLNDEIIGRVVDYSDGSPIADSRVIFYNVFLNPGEIVPDLESESEVRTDDNGYFAIDPNIDATNICAGGHRLYFDNCQEGIELDKKNGEFKVKLYSRSYVKIGILDSNIYSEEIEYIAIMPGFAGEGINKSYSIEPNEPRIIHGILKGGQTKNIYYTVHFTNGEIIQESISFTPGKFENPIKYIEY